MLVLRRIIEQENGIMEIYSRLAEERPTERVKFASRHKVGERIDCTGIWRNRVLLRGKR